MRGIHSYLVEINVDWFKRANQNGVEFETASRAGIKGEIEPKHGTVMAVPKGSKVKVGDTLFFIHYELYRKEESKGKWYVLIPPQGALGYCKQFPDIWNVEGILGVDVKPLHFLTASRIENPAWQKNQEATIVDHTIQKWFSRIYKTRDSDTSIKKGDIVWTYGGSEYFVKYIPDVVFLDRKYITFNATQNKQLNGYVLMDMINMGVADNGLVTEGGQRKRVLGTGVILNGSKHLKKNDIVRWDFTKQQMSPINPKTHTVPFHQIISHIEFPNA